MYKLCIAVAFLAVAVAKPNIGYAVAYPPYSFNSLYRQAAAYSVPEYPVSTYASQPLPVAPVSVGLEPQAYASQFMYSNPTLALSRTVAAPAPVVPAAAPVVTALPAFGAGVTPYFGYGFGPSPYWAK